MGRWRVPVLLALLVLPSCVPLFCPDLRTQQPRRDRGPPMVALPLRLRGGAMPGLGMGLSMDAMDRMMTPEMIRGAASMMSNMDPGLLNSMMSMTGVGGGEVIDAEEMKRAAEKLRAMSTDDILAMKNGALKVPLPGEPVSFFRFRLVSIGVRPPKLRGGLFTAPQHLRSRVFYTLWAAFP
jgi:hypothetical protein